MTLNKARTSGKPYKRESWGIWLVFENDKDMIEDFNYERRVILNDEDLQATDWQIK